MNEKDELSDRLRQQPIRTIRRRAAHLAEAVALYPVMLFFACSPVDWASSCGGWIGRTIRPRITASHRALRNLRRAMPENSEVENLRILRGMWENLGRSIAEYPHLDWICDPESGRVEVVNGERAADLLTDGKPGILFGGHFGNWEVGPRMGHRLMGDSLLSVHRAANNPRVERWLRRWRGPRAAVPKGAEGGRALIRHMRDGGHVGMLADQKMNDGIAVPFFGRPAMTAPAIARLALRFRCPVVPIRTERLQGARFRVTVEAPVEVSDTGDISADVLATMVRVNAVIESWVRAQPEQWLWLHRRWPD